MEESLRACVRVHEGTGLWFMTTCWESSSKRIRREGLMWGVVHVVNKVGRDKKRAGQQKQKKKKKKNTRKEGLFLLSLSFLKDEGRRNSAAPRLA